MTYVHQDDEKSNPPPPIDAGGRTIGFLRLFTAGVTVGSITLLVALLIDNSGRILETLFIFLVFSFIGLPTISVFALFCLCLSQFWQPKKWWTALAIGTVCAAAAFAIGNTLGLGLRIH